MNEFVHLHVHTQYSLNDSAAKIKELVARTKELGMNSIAITDHGNMFGVIEFYKAATEVGLKPILGCEAYVCPKGKEIRVRDNRHIVLLAKNMTGYHNLIQIMSDAAVNGFYYNPRTDYETLAKYSEGLICLTACLAGDVPREIAENGYAAGKKRLQTYIDIFGKDNVYIEIQDNGLPEQYEMNEVLIRLSQDTGVPLVATNDVHYINRSDAKNHDVLMAIQAKTTIYDKNRKIYGSDEFYLKSPEEMVNSKLPIEAIQNTAIIADRCNVEIEFGKYHIPKFDPPPEFKNSEEYLRYLAYKGLKERYPDYEERKDELHERLEYELSVITKMGYVDYFLIVQDYVNYAISKGAVPSPGRGSGAGSILAYCLYITHAEPIRHGLIFERFLNPDRISMPDIDWDIQDDMRQDIINYLVNKYGRERVAQIITFGTYAARLAVRAVARALNIPYRVADEVAKAIPAEVGITIKEALEKNPELNEWYQNDEQRRELLNIAMAIEGLPSHTGTHAAGMLITPENVTNYVPVWRNDNVIVAQFDMTVLEEIGLLKVDLLGLKTLTVISNTIKAVERNKGIKITNQDLFNAVDDPTSYILISKGMTQGVFQLEGDGMTAIAKELQPQNIDEVTALISLYRPGPMQYIPQYIANKRDPSKIQLRFEALKDVLTDTYGILVYQEQIMFASQILAGYPMAAADELRKAVGKKKKELIEQHRTYFIEGREGDEKHVPIPGALSKGYDRRELEEFYAEIEDFGRYCFNKSHGTCYAYLSAMTSWLKYHYPSEFMAALMTSVANNKDKIARYMKHCSDLGIKVLPPSINQSDLDFTAQQDGSIRFALSAVKDVGINAVKNIVKERRERGKFRSFSEFIYRCIGGNVNTKVVEALIRCGAFDEFGHKRSELLSMLFDICIEFQGVHKVFKNSPQQYLFDPVIHLEDKLPTLNELPMKTLLKVERAFTGFYLSGHPLDAVKSYINRLSNVSSLEFVRETDEQGNIIKDYTVQQDQKVYIVGILTRVNVISTKNNNLMAFADIEDMDGKIELIIFPQIYAQSKTYLIEDTIVYVAGRVSIKDEGAPQVIVEAIEKIDHKFMRRIYIQINNIDTELNKIKDLVSNPNCKGDIPVYLIIGNKQILLPERYWVNMVGYDAFKHYNIKIIMKEE